MHFDLFCVCEYKVKQVLGSLLPTKLHGNKAFHTYTALSNEALKERDLALIGLKLLGFPLYERKCGFRTSCSLNYSCHLSITYLQGGNLLGGCSASTGPPAPTQPTARPALPAWPRRCANQLQLEYPQLTAPSKPHFFHLTPLAREKQGGGGR